MNIEKLIRKCKKENARAQKALYDQYVGLLFSVIKRYISNPADVEDILLQAFLKVFQKLSDFDFINEAAFTGWIKRIAINEALMFIRKDYITIYKVEDDENADFKALASPGELEEKELMELIEQLPVGYKTVFLLHVVDGFAHKEIAENLGIAESTSRSQFFKARNLLQKKLSNNYGRAIGS